MVIFKNLIYTDLEEKKKKKEKAPDFSLKLSDVKAIEGSEVRFAAKVNFNCHCCLISS